MSHRKIFYGHAFRQPDAILRQEEEMPLRDHRGRVNEVDHGLSMPRPNSSTSAPAVLVQRNSDFLGLAPKNKRKELTVGNVNFPRRHKIPLLSINRAVRRLRLGTNPKSWGARNATIRHGRLYPAKNVAGLFPLGDPSSAVPSFQLRPVFGAATERVPLNNTTSRFIGLGDKSWDSFKNSFRAQGIEFSFLSQRTRQAIFKGSIAPKTPVLKLERSLARKPPASTASESTLVAFEPFAKPQVIRFSY